MTPSNLTILSSVREWQKHFNQAFNLAAAAQDVTYSSTQTIAGGLIICRNFTVNASVVLTISNPTKIICQTFTNNGTITMSPVSEDVLGDFKTTDAKQIPKNNAPFDVLSGGGGIAGGTAMSLVYSSGNGGASFGRGGIGFISNINHTTQQEGGFLGFRSMPSHGWKEKVTAFWYPIALFRNPVLGMGSGLNSFSGVFSTSLAMQRRGTQGGFIQAPANSPIQWSNAGASVVGGNPGSFLEVFSRVSVINSVGSIINAQGAAGGGSTSAPNGGGGGGGAVGIYSEGFVSQLGTINCSGGTGGTSGGVNSYGGGGGGGGGIFLTAPTITNSGTNTVNGGAAGTGNNGNGLAGTVGTVVAEPYLRLWMPGEDDVVQGTRYSAT